MVDRTFGDYFFIMFIYFFIGMIIGAAIYVAVAIFLNKLNKLIYGKGTPMAFIPIANVYLLGKLTLNKIGGLALIITYFIMWGCVLIDNTANGLLHAFMTIIVFIYYAIVLVLFIYAIIKYFKLKNSIRTKQGNDSLSQDQVTVDVNNKTDDNSVKNNDIEML